MASQVAVIGAGPCGLAQLRAFEEARGQGAKVPEVVCFERQSDVPPSRDCLWSL